MRITEETRLEELLKEYPGLKEGLVEINEKLKMLQSPLGKVMIKKATIAEMSKRSGMEAAELIAKLQERIGG